MQDLLLRLRERKLVQWALAYIAAAFALIQVLDVVAQRFGWPDALERVLILALVLGFFVTLVLAWYHGEKGAQRVTGTELLILALLLAIGGGLLWRSAAQNPVAPAADAANSSSSDLAAPARIPDKSIAVLPFENLSAEKDNAYFADGMQDEILTKLSKIAALRVISRTSTQKYASRPDNLPQIARQLGVANILEGSVQKAGNAVHINVQLIHAASDEHLWAESYDRTLDNIFGVEGEVAQAVADALDAKLTGAEKQAVAQTGTRNPAALDAYLRGRALDETSYKFNQLERAVDFYQQAARIDPDYVQAWTAMAIAMSTMFLNGVDAQRSTADAIRDAADAALRVAPDSADALVAQGAYLYRVRDDYVAARVFYQRALRQNPNDLDILPELFFVERRMGLWNDSIAHFRTVIARDPHNASILTQGAAEIFMYLRRFDEARTYLMQALKIAPDDPTTNAVLASLEQYLGNLDAADAWLAKVPADSRDFYEDMALTQQQLLRRRFADLVARALPLFGGGSMLWTNSEYMGLVDAAWAEMWLGKSAQAHAHFERLRESMHARGGTDSANQLRIFNSTPPLVYAGLGDWAQADALAKQEVELFKGDTVDLAAALYVQAKVYALHGDRDAAIAILQRLLSLPCGPTPPLLALDPFFDPIRSDPRFVALSKLPIVPYIVPYQVSPHD